MPIFLAANAACLDAAIKGRGERNVKKIYTSAQKTRRGAEWYCSRDGYD
jgi:hypothetical protein